MSEQKKKKRELEIAANFEKVLNHLPADFYFAFINALFEQKDIENQKKYLRIGSKPERIISKEDRVDLEILLSPGLSKILFEFKLGNEVINQVYRYAKTDEDALIVSIAKELNTNETENKKYDDKIVNLTWNELFNGLLKIASSEIQDKLIPQDTTELFSPDFPERRLGEPALSFLEDFLFTIRDRNLVYFKGERVLVVSGDMATKTSTQFNVYWFGKNWDKDFQYVVVVNKSTIQYIGEVKERYFRLEKLTDIENVADRKIIEDAFKSVNEKDSFSNQPIIILKRIYESKWGWKFNKKGAITQSHRYFKDIKNTMKHFNKGSNEELKI